MTELLPRLAPLLPAKLFDRLRTYPDPAAAIETERACADDLQQAIYALSSLHHTLTNFLPRYLLDLSPTPGQPHGEILKGSFIFADVTGFTALTGELSKRGSEGLEEMNRLMRALCAALLDPLLDSGGDLLIFAGDAVLACFPVVAAASPSRTIRRWNGTTGRRPARPDQSPGQDARWAARTALRLVQATAPFAHIQTPYGDFSLTMSAGVERGQAFAAVVGTRKRMELLISGGPVQGAMRAEEEGEPGQVIAGPAILPLLRQEDFVLRGNVIAGIQGGELGDYEPAPPFRHRRRLSTIFSRRIPDLIEHLQYVLAQVETLAPFIPPALFAQIARGEDFCQHPPVAVQFVNILGIEELALGPAGPAVATAVLQRYFVQAQEIVSDRRGIINQLDSYAQGLIFLNPFGALAHHEGAPGLAASAALELARALERVNQEFDLHPPLVQRTGLTYDRIFTGEIGYRHRREYVLAGPAVNLAARLMSKAAPGQIVLDPTAWEAVREDFLADSLPPLPLKGIPDPVPRFVLQGLRKGMGLHLADYPLAGRREELALLEERLEQAVAGRGGSLAVTGEAGMGKSRLIAVLAESARQRGVTVLSGRCRPFTRTTPYLPWAGLVGQWFELYKDLSPENRRQCLKERLAQFDLVASLPAFADLLGHRPVGAAATTGHRPVGAAATTGHRPVGARIAAPTEPVGAERGLFAMLGQRAEREPADIQALGALLTERAAHSDREPERSQTNIWGMLRERASIPQALHLLLERQALRQPTLVIIEDLQWMDPESREILEALVASSPAWPLLLLATARPETEWDGEQLLLPPLSVAGRQRLAAFALKAARLEPELADWLFARVGGSPLFILSYCQALLDAGAVVVDPASGKARQSGPMPQLPLSLQETLLAQVDRLGQEAREVMRRGVVIGVTFSIWLLARMCHEELLSDQLNEALDRAARRGLIAPPPPAQVYAFGSQSLHEAVYATLSHARRRTWHGQVGEYLVQAGEGEEATRYERLEQIAYHYSRGDDPHKAARFTRLAGDKARARQANEAALAFYTQTLAVTDGDGVAAEQRLAHEGIGDIHALGGESEAARTAYQTALRDGVALQCEGERRLRTKLALLAPLVGPTDSGLFEQAWRALPSSDPLRPWLGAALVWLRAGCGEREDAIALCRDLLPAGASAPTAREPVGALLREALENLEKGESLPAYADFFALFANFCLRSKK